MDESTEQNWVKNMESGRFLLSSELTDAGLDLTSTVTRSIWSYLLVTPLTIQLLRVFAIEYFKDVADV